MPRGITNSKTFEAALVGALDPLLTQWLEQYRAERRSGAEHSLFRPTVARGQDLVLHRIFLSQFELTNSFATLNNIPTYLRHFPTSLPRRISRLAWVRYHVESYLHELYIFQNRAESLLKQLPRAYRRQPCVAALEERCKRLETALKTSLAGVVSARGAHVHQRRFDDTSLRILEMVELLVAEGKRPRRDRALFFEDARMEEQFWMKSNNREIKKWLDQCGLALGEFLFMPDGSFRFADH